MYYFHSSKIISDAEGVRNAEKKYLLQAQMYKGHFGTEDPFKYFTLLKQIHKI
jgi:hypothetical protein